MSVESLHSDRQIDMKMKVILLKTEQRPRTDEGL